MRRIWLAAAILLMAGVARGDDVKPDDLNKLYKDTLVQLKAAQDRKAELAAENARLISQVAELERQLHAQGEKLAIKDQVDASTDKTEFLIDHYTAWKQFTETHPMIKMQWDLFIEKPTPLATLQVPFIAPEWPLSAG